MMDDDLLGSSSFLLVLLQIWHLGGYVRSWCLYMNVQDHLLFISGLDLIKVAMLCVLCAIFLCELFGLRSGCPKRAKVMEFF
jgi:hypothetical protein